MRDIFNDPAFNSFLYGGVQDLEEGVGHLVYTLFQIPTVTPAPFSCEGHLGSFKEKDWRISATRENYITTCDSYISYQYLDKGTRFEKLIYDFLNQFPFSRIEKSVVEQSPNLTHKLTLTFEDLVEEISEDEIIQLLPKDIKEENSFFSLPFNYGPPLLDIRKCEVEKALAIRRHQEMKSAWNKLNTILRKEYELK